MIVSTVIIMESTVLGEVARALTTLDGREGLKSSFEEQKLMMCFSQSLIKMWLVGEGDTCYLHRSKLDLIPVSPIWMPWNQRA